MNCQEENRDAPDWREANEFLRKELGDEVYFELRFPREQLTMHDAEILAASHKKGVSEEKKENPYQRLLKKTRVNAVILDSAEPLSEGEADVMRLLMKTRVKAVILDSAEPLSEGEADVTAVIINSSLKDPPFVFELDEEVVFSGLDLDGPEEEVERLIRQFLIEEKGYDSKVVDEYIKYKRGDGNAEV
jgi:hypothetical protein